MLKAIEKDPKARYQSAEAMAEDLRLFLADEPIRARQVTAAERYWRWARRNPVIAVLGGVLTAVLIATTVGSLLAAQWFHTQAETEHTLAAKEAAAKPTSLARQPQERAAPDRVRHPLQPRPGCLGHQRRPPPPQSPRAVAASSGRGRPPRLGVALSLAARSRGSAHAPGPGRQFRRRGIQSRRANPRRPRGKRPHPAMGPAHR